MFRNYSSSIGVMYFTFFFQLAFFSSGILLPSAALQAETSSGVTRFTLQREKTPGDDLSLAHTISQSEIEITEKSGTYKIKITAVIDAPADHVRHVLTDYSHLYKLNPSITKSEVIKQEKDGTVSVRTRVNGCASYFCEELNRVEKVKQLPSGEIIAEVVPKQGQFRSGRTHWQIKELGEQCEVTYLANMRPDIYIPPVVSKFLVKKAIKQEAQVSLVNLEKLASGLCGRQKGKAGKLSICN